MDLVHEPGHLGVDNGEGGDEDLQRGAHDPQWSPRSMMEGLCN